MVDIIEFPTSDTSTIVEGDERIINEILETHTKLIALLKEARKTGLKCPVYENFLSGRMIDHLRFHRDISYSTESPGVVQNFAN